MSFQEEINKIKLILSNQPKISLVDVSGHPTSSPDNEDTTTTDILYEGWTSLNLVKKTDTTTPDITIRKWATGTWANRATLTYE